METKQMITMLVVVLAPVVAWRIYKWIENGGLYYLQCPAARLMDDLGKTKRLDTATIEQIIQRVGRSNNPAKEVEKLREELHIN